MKEELIYRTVPNVFCCCCFKLRERKSSKLAEFDQSKPYNGTNDSILCIEQTSHNILNGPAGIQNKHCALLFPKNVKCWHRHLYFEHIEGTWPIWMPIGEI